ncbi:MAG: diphosphomevalonate decarboxylase [Thaumarchaeota archaeon]|nr:diphosphomevalonate decarboxylase [Candidatus Calditenuaceae archaeon]MDW8187274.1 diphosphomevalonate decarboxylase [Nitrososphaerota archaeon]
MRSKARAFTMQALVKYHGMRDWELRIPYHDSVSVNTDVAYVDAQVEFGDFDSDVVIINGQVASGRSLERVIKVIDRVRAAAEIDLKVRVVTENHPKVRAKGMGYSAAAGASIAKAALYAAGLRELAEDTRYLSRVARLLAGSACRSAVGKYARWYSGSSDEDSYADRIGDERDLDLRFVVIPLSADLSTEDAHREAESSPFFPQRIKTANERCDQVEKAIRDGDFETFGKLVERDAMELLAVTMTGDSGIILVTHDSLRVISIVKALRRRGVPVYYSMQTGPTVYVDTLPEHVDEVDEEIRRAGYFTLVSGLGGGAEVIE